MQRRTCQRRSSKTGDSFLYCPGIAGHLSTGFGNCACHLQKDDRTEFAPGSLQLVPQHGIYGIPLMIAVFGHRLFYRWLSAISYRVHFAAHNLTFLEASRSAHLARKGSAVLWIAIRSALKKPLVWAPLAGIVMAFTHIPMPQFGEIIWTDWECNISVAICHGLVLSG